MGWATKHIERLQNGETIEIRPKGNSMTPIIESGQLCRIVPINEDTIIEKGTVVLCKVRGKQFLHLVTAVKPNQIQISNNKGHVNGWTTMTQIYGVLEDVRD